MTPEEVKEKTQRGWDEIWKGNMDAMDEVATPDVVCHEPPMPDIRGRDGLKQWARELRRAFSDIQFRFDEFVSMGETAAARWTFQGTHTGQLPDVPLGPPTGKRVTWTGVAFVHMESGAAKEMWQYADLLGMMQQLGVVPSMGKAA
jgi:steroid delta-isomerase-like uncharacterized protein